MPLYTLDKRGISPDTFFAKTQVTGSHENAVLTLAQGTVDVAANWWNADDDSNLTRMLNKGMLKNPDGSPMKKEDFRIILKSELIINSPTAMASNLPEELKSAIRAAFLEAAAKDKTAFRTALGWQEPALPAYRQCVNGLCRGIGCHSDDDCRSPYHFAERRRHQATH
jgi:phosphonate transport system substrate-binding protein